jgi:pimeloyl-ACP methyl ester carboxylesterase
VPYLTRDDGVRLAYEIHNPDGPRTPLILTHGFAATAQMWDSNVEALAKDRPVLVWDQRGHGRSDGPADPAKYGERIGIDDIAALLDAAGFDRAVIGGMSLGGYLSLAFHYAYPQLVAGIILVDTGPGYKNDATRAAWNEQAEGSARRIEAGDFSVFHTPEMRQARHERPQALALVARHVLTQRDDRIIQSLPSIAKPTLVIVGADDVPFHGSAEYMATRIPGARKVIVPDAGHAPNVDQPDIFNSAVAEFLEDL